MTNCSKILVAVMLALPFCGNSQYTDQINSNRPGETMSAFAVGKTVIQVESGIYGVKEKHNIQNYEANGFGLDLNLRYGIFLEKLELLADLQYQSQKDQSINKLYDRSALKQTVLGAKYLLYDPFKNKEKKVNVYSWKANHSFNLNQLIPAVSVFAGANLVFSNNPYYFSREPEISPKAMLILQNHLGDGSWVFVTNIIADYIGTNYPSYGYDITLTKGISRNLSAFIENQVFMSDFYSDTIFRSGGAFLINDDIQVDLSASTSIKNTPSVLYGGIGISWRFDQNYREVKVPVDNKETRKNEKNAKKQAKQMNKKVKKNKKGTNELP